MFSGPRSGVSRPAQATERFVLCPTGRSAVNFRIPSRRSRPIDADNEARTIRLLRGDAVTAGKSRVQGEGAVTRGQAAPATIAAALTVPEERCLSASPRARIGPAA